jgi:hypothetical protein
MIRLARAGQTRDFHGGMLIRRSACHQVEVLVVVGRHPVGRLPVPPRGLGDRAILGNQDGGT